MTEEIVHANALVVGGTGLLIRGASGSGKSALTLALMERAGRMGKFASLVGDDQVRIEAQNGRLIARSISSILGLLEVRGIGILRLAHSQATLIRLTIDLIAKSQLVRLPGAELRTTRIAGIAVNRIALSMEKPDLAALMTVVLGHPATDIGAN
jgi:HPr kinase/phosphorylase